MSKETLTQDYSTDTVYDIEGFPVYIRCTDLCSYPQGRTTLHWHKDVEFLVALNGSMQCSVDGKVQEIHTGEGLFINARQPHISCVENKRQCRFLLIQIQPVYFESLPAIKETYINQIVENAALPCLILKPQVLWQKEILIKLESVLAWYDSPAAPLRIMSAFSEVWALLYENTGSYSWEREVEPGLVIMQNMIGYIQHNYRKKISLQDIADAGGVSISKCCSLFASSYGLSPINYLLEYRLSESAYQLRNSSETVTEIALTHGFSDSNYFARCFRKWSGKTPTVYRREETEQRLLHT